MTFQVIAQTVAAQAMATLLFALALRRGIQTPKLRPVPARTKRMRD
ncbi:hypothetical protein GOFOIKOB_4552 [Methylobacterium tardum]|jgi:hypothetical protein|uniref:Uncharacterized protein n=1 Tax=Methylobacterium tardum TaxID=374432 RepID=A0AA37TK87_9HYPH|nr:hypothetical protein GOFOIKOB_4552 [Methylobacterium tardum]GLS73612.1 hypothetical protein GCM10007890_56270 [Methylobacterium tardum]